MATLSYTTIDDPGEAQTQLYSINNSGEIVGAGADNPEGVGGPVHSFVVGVGNFDVGSLDISTATGINDSGQIVGGYFDGTGHYYLDVGGTVTTLFTGFAGMPGIDDAGDIVGLNAAQQPFVDVGGTISVLNPNAAESVAISANGTIAISYASGSVEGTLSSGFLAVNVPSGDIVQGINDNGQIVGWNPNDNGGLGSGFLMDANGTIYQINIPGADGTRVEGINDNGDVVGVYFDSSHNEHGFLTSVSSIEAANAPPLTITAPANVAVAVGKQTAISGVSISEALTTSGETFTVTLTDAQGNLAATGMGVAGSGTTQLTISGTLSQVKSDLATLTDTDGSTEADAIKVVASDSGGDNATPATIGVTVSGLPTITAPTAATIQKNQASAISGLSLSESGNTNGETFTVTLSDSHGLLAVTGTGVTGSNTTKLTLSGTLAQINGDLATVTDTDASAARDTINVNASDSFGNTSNQKSIAVSVAPPGTTNTINMGPNTSVTFGDANTTVNAKGFNFIKGGNGNDVVNGGGNTTVSLGNGNDTVKVGLAGLVTLGNGNDSVTAGDLSSITLGDGNDTVRGGNLNTITVGNGNDTIYAGNWPPAPGARSAGLQDVITLGSGHDTVFAGEGEQLNLGAGPDTIAFGVNPSPPQFGYEQVYNFAPQRDVLEFNVALFANFAAVMSNTQQVGHDTQITYDVNNIITLHNVNASDLHASNFKFVS